MGTLVGREDELSRGRAILHSAARGRYARALRFVGQSGVGKTTLAHALLDEATADGWLVASAATYNIHASIPNFTVRRLTQSIRDSLRSDAEQYESGLALDAEGTDGLAEGFIRLLEGVTLDHRLLLFVDDAQWADPRSRALISEAVKNLADRCIVLLSAERSDELREPAFALVDESIHLGNFSHSAAIDVIRSIYPGVASDMADAIAVTTRGRVIDLVAVSNAARESNAATVQDVSESARRVVARDIGLLNVTVRTFLQTCALIEEPIDLALLRQLYSQDELVAMTWQLSGRYLVTQADGLRFVHATIMEAVRETIAIEIPLRYRIIEAIKALQPLRPEDYERLAKQLVACGDRAGAHAALMTLADEAAAQGLSELCISATEHAATLHPIAPDRIVQVYARLSHMYNASGRDTDAIRVSGIALSELTRQGMPAGAGPHVAAMSFGHWFSGREREALDVIAQYEPRLADPIDRAHAATTRQFFAVAAHDAQTLSETAALVEALGPGAPAIFRFRNHVNHALYHMRDGQEIAALEHLSIAEELAERQLPFVAPVARSTRLQHALFYRGVSAVERYMSKLPKAANEPMVIIMRAMTMIARGEFSDVDEYISERLRPTRDVLIRRALLGLRAVASVLGGDTKFGEFWPEVEGEVDRFLGGARFSSLLPSVSAWCAHPANRDNAMAPPVLRNLVTAYSKPLDISVMPFPLLLSRAALVFDDAQTIAAISTGERLWSDRSPWSRAQHALARELLASRAGRIVPFEAEKMFTRLGAPFFASLAAQGGAKAAKPTHERPANTTRREREIAALVAEGLTNKQIAERLVLSERTVEGHIANLFVKVDVSSRTQLAAWYFRLTATTA